MGFLGGGGGGGDSVARKQLALQQQQIKDTNKKIQLQRLSALKRSLGAPTAGGDVSIPTGNSAQNTGGFSGLSGRLSKN